jgi:hypothetical protein
VPTLHTEIRVPRVSRDWAENQGLRERPSSMARVEGGVGELGFRVHGMQGN